MTSKSAKLKAHRVKQRQYAGRPAKEGVERYPGGQIKHEERQREVKSVVMEARARVHNLREVTQDMIADFGGYTAGRLFVDGRINKQQLEAGNEYAVVAFRYCMATGIPFPSARAQELGKVRGFSGEETQSAQERATRATNDMMRLLGVLQSCAEGPRVKQTVHNLFVMDEEALRFMPENQLGYLKRGLNELILHDGLRRYGKTG